MIRPSSHIQPNDLTFAKLKSAQECANFQCERGKTKYADFVKNAEEAETEQLQKSSVTWLFRHRDEVVGYITLAMGSLEKERLPSEVRENYRHMAMPCLLLAQIARAESYSNRGVGRIMVAWAIELARKISEEVGCRYIILEPEEDRKEHYERYLWFKRLPKNKKKNKDLMYFDLGQHVEVT